MEVLHVEVGGSGSLLDGEWETSRDVFSHLRTGSSWLPLEWPQRCGLQEDPPLTVREEVLRTEAQHGNQNQGPSSSMPCTGQPPWVNLAVSLSPPIK